MSCQTTIGGLIGLMNDANRSPTGATFTTVMRGYPCDLIV